MGAICRLQIEKFSHFSVAKMGQNAAKGAKKGQKKSGLSFSLGGIHADNPEKNFEIDYVESEASYIRRKNEEYDLEEINKICKVL